FHAESFNLEFHSVAYYYLLKLKQIKIPNVTYIKIYIINKPKSNGIKLDNSNGILYINCDFNFSEYIGYSNYEKLKFQCKIVYDILKSTFINLNIEWKILDLILGELQACNWKLEIELLRKKILRKYIYTIKLYLDIDTFTYVCIIE